MKKFLFILLLSLSSFCQAQDFMVGASEAPVNPSIPSYIAGHTQNRKFTGIRDSLFVKAVVVSSAERNITILTVDCIGLLYPQLQDIRRIVQQEASGVNASHIVLSSTHTHAGPDVVGLWGPDLMHSGVDSHYIRFLVKTAARQIITAWNNRKMTKAVYGEGIHGEGWVFNISEPAELDRSVTVLQFIDKAGKSVATLTNFACHPTFVDAVHHEVSADYPQGFYRRMNQSLGGVNLFIQGSIGGWVQPENEPQTFEQAYFRGSELADKTISLLQHSIPVKGNSIGFSSRVFDLPVENAGFSQLSQAGVINRKIDSGVTTEIAWFSMGNAQFATHPGETVPAMSLASKELMKAGGPKFVMGLSMDALGYILKPSFFDSSKNIPHSKYLCSMSVGPQTSAIVMNVLRELSAQKQ